MSEFTSLVTSSRFFITPPNRLLFVTTSSVCTLLWLPQSKVSLSDFRSLPLSPVPCCGCPKAKYGSIRLLFATTIACCLALVAPKQSAVQSSYLLLLNGSQRLCVFTQRHYFLLTEFQPTCCRARLSRSWAISIFRKQCSCRPISTPSVVDATIRLSGLRSFNPKI